MMREGQRGFTLSRFGGVGRFKIGYFNGDHLCCEVHLRAHTVKDVVAGIDPGGESGWRACVGEELKIHL